MGFRADFLSQYPDVGQLAQSRPDLFDNQTLASIQQAAAETAPVPEPQLDLQPMQPPLAAGLGWDVPGVMTPASAPEVSQGVPQQGVFTIDQSQMVSPEDRARQMAPGLDGMVNRTAEGDQPEDFIAPLQGGLSPGQTPASAMFGLDDEFRQAGADVKKSRDAYARAIGREAESQANLQTQISEAQQQYQNDLAEEEAAAEISRDLYRIEVEEMENQIATEVDQLKTEKIDTGRFWKNAGTGKTIMGALSIGLGALGAAISGRGGNAALDIIENQIQQDINAQKAEISQRGKALTERKGILGNMYRKLGDMDKAEAASKIALMDRLKVDIAQMTAKSQSEIVRANADRMLAEIDMKQAEQRQILAGKAIEKAHLARAQSAEKSFDREQALQKGFLANENTKQLMMTNESMTRIEAARDDAAGDLSLIFAYMKMLDPGSVVREGEFATAQNSAGIPEQIRNRYNRALNGERLSPDQRDRFKGQAREIFKKQVEKFQPVKRFYENQAQRYGLAPSNVLVMPQLEGVYNRIGSDRKLAQRRR